MKTQNRNGVLGLETAKQVMVTFLVLAVTGIAILLSLTALDTGVGDTIDNQFYSKSVTNESADTVGVDITYANQTGYTLSGYNSSWSGMALTTLWKDYNQTADTSNEPSGYNVTVTLVNATLSSVGVLTNATATDYANVSASYSYTYTVDTNRVDSIVGNVSAGLVTFFASTGTIFSILIVVVIILAISIIIWAVGRFGQTTDAINL